MDTFGRSLREKGKEGDGGSGRERLQKGEGWERMVAEGGRMGDVEGKEVGEKMMEGVGRRC